MLILGEDSPNSEEEKKKQRECDEQSNSSESGSYSSDDQQYHDSEDSKIMHNKKLRIKISMSEQKRDLLFPTAKEIFLKKNFIELIASYDSEIEALKVKNEFKDKSIEGYKFEIFSHRETIIVIQNVPRQATIGDLVNKFAKFGQCMTPRIKPGQGGCNTATIQFLTEESVDLAIYEAATKGIFIHTHKLAVRRESEIGRFKGEKGKNPDGHENFRSRGQQYRGRVELSRGRGRIHDYQGRGRGRTGGGELRYESRPYSRGRGTNFHRGREYYPSYQPPQYLEKEEKKIYVPVPFFQPTTEPKIKTKIIQKYLFPFFKEFLGAKNCRHKLQKRKRGYVVETTIDSESELEIAEIRNILNQLKYTTRTVHIKQTDQNTALIKQKIEKYRNKYKVSIEATNNDFKNYKIEGLVCSTVDLVYQKLLKMQEPVFQPKTNYY